MITEWQFNNAVEAFRKVIKESSMTEDIKNVEGIHNSYNDLNDFVRTEFKEFAASPDAQLNITGKLRDLRNWKEKDGGGFGAVSLQRNDIILLVKQYLDFISAKQHFKPVAW